MQMDAAVADAMQWVSELIPTLSATERAKTVEAGRGMPRWIDHPVLKRPQFRALAAHPPLVAAVESLIGKGVDVYFSQIFFKPPEEGSPKPAHQDNFYAGPNNPDGLVTAWVALDEASPDNGCLYFVDGSHRGPIHPHSAPKNQPFHLQISEADLAPLRFAAAPVPKGGVSFHHGGTIHRSSANRSPRWRRAVAITYVTKDTYFGDPKLNYDDGARVAIT
jgi:ectoine hydroxylase-related dioxygenase (phytanoyl-CoA dioxygenase family)